MNEVRVGDDRAEHEDTPSTRDLLGRRARKKDAVRRSLRVAALRLVSEQGLAEVTVEDITDAADVSKRTFFNYFSCKEDALVGPGRELGERIADELASRPGTEPPLQALRAVFERLVGDVEHSPERRLDWAARMRLVQAYPSELLPRQLAAFAELEQAVVAGVAERAGADVATDLYPALVGAVAVAAARVAFTQWCKSDEALSLVALLDQAFDLLAGVGSPSAVPRSAGVPGGRLRGVDLVVARRASEPRSPAPEPAVPPAIPPSLAATEHQARAVVPPSSAAH